MYGLDVFMQLRMNAEHGKSLIASGHAPSVFGGQLIKTMCERLGYEITLGDYGAVATALFPELTKTERFRVGVDTTFGPNRGMTVCDRREKYAQEGDPNFAGEAFVDVVMEIDVEAMRNLWIETISRS